MKLLVIGAGDCGCRLAGEFAELNRKAKAERRVQIVTGAYGVNNDQANLTSLAKSKRKELQAIFIDRITEDKNKSAEAGAEIMREEGGRVMTAINPNNYYDTDAVLLIAGSAGSLGAGSIPIMAQQLKERHIGKPIYALLVLPFDSEAAEPQCIHNTAVCLKSTSKITDAVFLTHNEKAKLAGKASSPEDTDSINKAIALPYYDLLCASEDIAPKYAGARTIGIGDMLQTLEGWTAIGTGQTEFPVPGRFQKQTQSFQEKGSETQKAIEAMNAALGNLSIDFKLEDASKALYLLSIPAKGANVDMAKILGSRLRDLTKNAVIRGGDFYGAKDCAQVTLVISNLTYLETVKNYYDRAVSPAKTA